MSALDEILTTIRRLPLPERLRLIERAAIEAAEDTPKPASVSGCVSRLSVDAFLTVRLTPPAGVGPVSLQDIERAIAEGAIGGRSAKADSLLGLMGDEPDLVDRVGAIAYEVRRKRLSSARSMK